MLSSADSLAAVALVGIALSATPGPSMLYVLSRTVGQSRAAGIASALGLCLGGVVLAVATALGLAAVFAAFDGLVTALRFVGAAYLVWLGIQALRAGQRAGQPVSSAVVKTAHQQDNQADAARPAQRLDLRQWLHFFGQGFLTNALNPKAVLIFLTFLPQFMDPHAPLAPQFLTLGSIMSGLCLFWYVPLAYMLGRIRHIFENSRFQKWMHRCTGLVFIAFGLKLATAQAGAE